jgi:DNA modification methylase
MDLAFSCLGRLILRAKAGHEKLSAKMRKRMTKHNNKGDFLFQMDATKAQGPVECFGMTFTDDNARREHFLEILRKKLQDPTFRAIEGFPVGSDEDILALSDPPYYTACPNPFITDFIKQFCKPYDPSKPYSREPFSADLLGKKSSKIYMAHTYHTKVPPESIIPLLEHYTKPGDIILDPFCGSGMTGVAVHMLNANHPDKEPRYAIISDLSPFATFLSHQMTHAINETRFKKTMRDFLGQLRSDVEWIYSHKDSNQISFSIWSDIWICPNCNQEQSDWDLTVDEKTLTIKKPVCATCRSEFKRSDLARKKTRIFDPFLRITREQSQQVMVRLALKNHNRITLVKPDTEDIEILNKIFRLTSEIHIPIAELPIGFNTQQPISSHNFTHVHDYYTIRNLYFIARYIEKARKLPFYHDLLFALTSALVKTASKLHAIGFGGSINLAGQAPNTLQIPSSGVERNLFQLIEGKAKDLEAVFSYAKSLKTVIVSTSPAQNLQYIPSSSIDYIFTDPPFGANINYSEVSYIYEAWLGVFTNNVKEAIVNRSQEKTVQDYEKLMMQSLTECYRILKPGHWITVEFHNSANSIWNAIQNALGEAGFVLADVRIFDKGQGTWKQMTSSGAVKQDLIISAYKPNSDLEDRFKLKAGNEEGVWDFLRAHLKQLPIFVSKDNQAEVIAERQNYLLFDRMVAFHVRRGVTVPLSAADFYSGIAQRFSERDGMFFLPEQVAEYDRKRLTVREVLQLKLFVIDESSAIQWLKQQIVKKPQTFQELHPQFLKEISAWQKFEMPLELSELLEQNFLRYDGKGEVPSQIHSYLSTNFRELRNLSKDVPELRTKAKDRWYVSDPNKAGDLEKLRERSLLKEFWEYLPAGYKPTKLVSEEGFIPGLEPKVAPIPHGKKMKIIRLEAVRAGFKLCWQNRDYRTIIAVAQRIPENVLQEDPKLLMWYDQAVTRLGDENNA